MSDLLESPMVPLNFESKFLVWSASAPYPGYTSLQAMHDYMDALRWPNYLEWEGDGIYPKVLNHPSFAPGKISPAIAFIRGNPVWNGNWMLSPRIAPFGYTINFRDGSDVQQSNQDSTELGPGVQQLSIYNSTVPYPNLNEVGYHYYMVIL